MSVMTDFIQDRNEAFKSGDIGKIKNYCRKYEITIPEDEDIFLASVHKTVCNLYLVDNSPITLEQFNKSFDWLKAHGYSASISFDENDTKEGESDD